MNKNILNKNLIIYNVKNITDKKNFLIMISINLGWKIIKIYQNKNTPLSDILLGYNKLYKFFFKIKGFGYKWKYNLNSDIFNNSIFFKIGFTHRIGILLKKDIKYKMTKKRFIIKNRSYKFIRNNLNFIFILYKKYLYNKKGIFLRGTKYRIKISKKKSKF